MDRLDLCESEWFAGNMTGANQRWLIDEVARLRAVLWTIGGDRNILAMRLRANEALAKSEGRA